MFPDPDTIDKEINQEIIELIKIKINEKNLTFYDMLQYFEKQIESMDYKRAIISAYYITNIIKNKTENEQKDIVLNLKLALESCKNSDSLS